VVTCGEDLMDGCFSSWTKTPAGTYAQVDPILESMLAPTLCSPYHMVNLQAGKLILQLAYFLYIGIHHLLVAVPLFVDLLNHKKRVAIHK
jgi:hypothetical protein